MALDSDASAVAARVFNRSGTSKRRASAVQSTRSTLAHPPLAALGVMQLQRRVGAASRAFDQSTVELPFKLAGSTAGIRENPDPTQSRPPHVEKAVALLLLDRRGLPALQSMGCSCCIGHA